MQLKHGLETHTQKNKKLINVLKQQKTWHKNMFYITKSTA